MTRQHADKFIKVYDEFGDDVVPRFKIRRRNANKFIRIYEELGSTSSRELGFEALYQIATMPEEARDIEHEIPSTGEVKKVEDMTVREHARSQKVGTPRFRVAIMEYRLLQKWRRQFRSTCAHSDIKKRLTA